MSKADNGSLPVGQPSKVDDSAEELPLLAPPSPSGSNLPKGNQNGSELFFSKIVLTRFVFLGAGGPAGQRHRYGG